MAEPTKTTITANAPITEAGKGLMELAQALADVSNSMLDFMGSVSRADTGKEVTPEQKASGELVVVSLCMLTFGPQMGAVEKAFRRTSDALKAEANKRGL